MYKLGKKEILMCESLGYGLARTCIEGIENNRKFYKIASILTMDKRDNLLREVIYFKSFLVDIKLSNSLPGERYKIIRSSFVRTMLDIWTNETAKSFLNKVSSYCNPIDEVFPDLMVNAEIEPFDIPANKFQDFMTDFLKWLMEDVDNLTQTVESSSDIAITNYEHWNKNNQKIIDDMISGSQKNSGCLGSVLLFTFVIFFLAYVI